MAVIKAAFFDVDGTTLKNEHIHGEATFNVTQNLDLPISQEDFDKLWTANLGKGHGVVYEALQEKFPDISDTKEVFVRLCMAEYLKLIKIPGKLEARPETFEAIMLAKDEKGMVVEAVSNAEHAVIEAGLDEAGLGGVFSHILGIDDLRDKDGKPAPELKKPNPHPYTSRMEANGVEPGETVVFEDSRSGAEAGVASGAITIQIVDDPDNPDMICPDADYHVFSKEDYQAVLQLMRDDKLEKKPSDGPQQVLGASKLLAYTL